MFKRMKHADSRLQNIKNIDWKIFVEKIYIELDKP